MQINKSGGLGSNNFLFGDQNLKQRNRKKMCNATIREKRVRDILFSKLIDLIMFRFYFITLAFKDYFNMIAIILH